LDRAALPCRGGRRVSSGFRPLSALGRMLLVCLLTMLSGLPVASAAGEAANPRTKVVVAAETWARLIYLDNHQQPQGPIVDFVKRMNEAQDRYDFQFLVLPRLRVNRYFIEKKADVYPLRTLLWTEPELNLQATRTIVTSGDVYIARRNNPYGGKKIFEDVKDRSIAGVRGYHYHLFSNNPDEDYIHQYFKASLLNSNETVVDFVLAGHAEIGIVPEFIVAEYFRDPKMRQQLIISDQFDSRVEFSNLVRKDGPISVEQMNSIIDLMVRSGDVEKLRATLRPQ
jgi:ABC-type amino acid transport substrate-binding protein